MIKVVIIILAYSSFVFATNGDNVIGSTAKSRALGGTGIANHMGVESIFKNPSLLHQTENAEVSFGGLLFMPSVTATTNSGTEKSVKSAADQFLVPAVGLITQYNDKITLGFGMFGTGGLGLDYRDNLNTHFNMRTALSMLKMSAAAAYKIDDKFAVGLGIQMMYGTLDITYNNPSGAGLVGNGMSDHIGTGFDLGLSYAINSNFTLGFNYQSKIDMEYKGVIKNAAANFGLTGFSDKLAQPSEMGLGASYENDLIKVNFNVKQIKWSAAEGYDKFKWADQTVMALGGEYKMNQWALRYGVNMADAPIKDEALSGTIGALNALGFPATSDSHYALGFGHKRKSGFEFDLAYVMSPETEVEVKNFSFPIKTKHSESSIALAGTWKF